MGQLLSQPITDKTITNYERRSFSYTIGSMQGYRLTMEDAHEVMITPNDKIAVFGVFDGHGGKSTAKYVSLALVNMIFKRLENFIKRSSTRTSIANDNSVDGSKPIERNEEDEKTHKLDTEIKQQDDYMRLIRNSFFKVDSDLYYENKGSGTTAIVASIVNWNLIVSNTGDSRCIISCNGAPKTLSYDHKPTNLGEEVRIRKGKGFVSNNRVDGVLGLSRAFGDFSFKSTYNKNPQIPPESFKVTVEPEFISHKITSQDHYIILACDGIWDCFTNRQLVRYINQKLVIGLNLDQIVEHIFDDCIYMADNVTGIGFDNMSLIIIALHRGYTLEEWYTKTRSALM